MLLGLQVEDFQPWPENQNVQHRRCCHLVRQRLASYRHVLLPHIEPSRIAADDEITDLDVPLTLKPSNIRPIDWHNELPCSQEAFADGSRDLKAFPGTSSEEPEFSIEAAPGHLNREDKIARMHKCCCSDRDLERWKCRGWHGKLGQEW